MYPIIFMYPFIFTRFDPAMASEHMDETPVSIPEENLELQALSDVVKHVGHVGEHSTNEQLPSNPDERHWITLALKLCDNKLRGTLMTAEIMRVLHQASLKDGELKIYLKNNEVLPIPRQCLHSLQDRKRLIGVSPARIVA